MTTPSVEKLLAAHMLLKRTHEELPVDELIVRQAMEDPLWTPDFISSAIDTNAVFLTVLRTGSIFILDEDEALPAISSLAPEMAAFPPLPFTRIWIELRGADGNAAPFASYERNNGDPVGEADAALNGQSLQILGTGLVEVVQGQVWDLLTPFALVRRGELPPLYSVIGHRLTPKGFTEEDFKSASAVLGEAAVRTQEAILSLAVTAAHLIVAENVPHEEYILPRHQRRRMEREWNPYKTYKPKIYFVNLKAAGEKRKRNPGGVPGYREYHSRWLVRGHWRQYPDKLGVGGRRWSGKRVWVKPYVKGPAGAPWRGRPIYVEKKAAS